MPIRKCVAELCCVAYKKTLSKAAVKPCNIVNFSLVKVTGDSFSIS